jgi:neutral/alkaline ceramidase-like enzyme
MKIGLGLYEYNFEIGLTMGGYMARGSKSTATHDPISCRAVIIENNDTKMLLIEADFVGLEKIRVIALKKEINAKYDIPIEHILIGIIHTHSSVLNMNLFASPSEGVLEKVDEGIRLAVDQAFSNIFTGYLEIFKGDIKGVSFNRRDWDPLSDIVNDEAVIIKIFDEADKLHGLLYNYSCHPVVMSEKNLELSADWPYYTQQYLRENLKDNDLFVIFLQGTPGNLNPVNVPMSKKPPTPNTFEDCQEIGDSVGKQLLSILNSKGSNIGSDNELSQASFKGLTESIDLPIDDEDKTEFFEEFSEISEIDGNFYVKSVIQALKIDSLCIIGLPGEIFSEIGLNFKRNSGCPFTMVVGYANDYVGYIGPKAVYEVGGYEMMMMSLSPEEGPVLEEKTMALIHKL